MLTIEEHNVMTALKSYMDGAYGSPRLLSLTQDKALRQRIQAMTSVLATVAGERYSGNIANLKRIEAVYLDGVPTSYADGADFDIAKREVEWEGRNLIEDLTKRSAGLMANGCSCGAGGCGTTGCNETEHTHGASVL